MVDGREIVKKEGKVVTVNASPEFLRDICPYFQGTYMMIATLIIIIYTENFFFPIWLVFLTSPMVNFATVGDNINLTPKS